MKFSLSLLSICILSSILIYSCSTEEEESVAPVVQTPQPEPEPLEYTLTVSAADGGTVSTEGGTYEEGTEVTITASANEGYRFTGWEGNNSTSDSLTITLNSNQTYQALFELIPIYTLTVTTSEGGTVSSEGGEYEEGTEVELTATPNEGYEFVGWEGNDSSNSDLTITLNSNLTIQPIFQIVAVQNILFISGDGGSIKITGENIEEQGVELLYAINQTEISVEAIPEQGFIFVGWISNSIYSFEEKLQFPGDYQFLNSNNNITLNASFAPNLIDEASPNPISELDISNLEEIQGRDGYNFYYNISDNLPIDWINEFKIIMGNLNSVVHIPPRVKTSPRDGEDEMHIFAWNSNEETPFTAFIGNNRGMCICGNISGKFMLLEINNNEFINDAIHRYSVIAHEYFHVYQNNASIVEPPYFKYLMEGGAATFESLYIQQYYNINYFLIDQHYVSQLAVDSPILFETWNDDAVETNYSDSVFIFLALVKEIQKQGNTEIQAFKKVFNNWWKSGRTDVTKEVLFEEVFGFSMESFYASLSNYSPEIQSVLPSETITLEEIFEDL